MRDIIDRGPVPFKHTVNGCVMIITCILVLFVGFPLLSGVQKMGISEWLNVTGAACVLSLVRIVKIKLGMQPYRLEACDAAVCSPLVGQPIQPELSTSNQYYDKNEKIYMKPIMHTVEIDEA